MYSFHVSSRNRLHLKKLDVLQAQALRICSGSFKTSPVSAMQVEMGEMPLKIRRIKLMLAYWVNLQGHYDTHPAKSVLKDCWEHNESHLIFAWVGDAVVENNRIPSLQLN